MATGDKPVLFEVRVDTKTGEVDLQRFTGKVEESMRKSGKAVDGFASSMKSVRSAFGLASAAVGAYLAAVGVNRALSAFTGLVEDGVKAATEQELAERKLVAALERRGLAVDQNLARMKAWANAIQFQIGVDDELILSQESIAIRFGLTAEQAQKLTVASANVAAQMGRDFESVNQAITRALVTGSAGALQRLGVKLDETALKSGNVNKVLEQLDKTFTGAAAASLKSFDGATRLLNMSWGEFKETIGDVVVRSPSLRAAIEGVSRIIQRLGVAVGTDQDLLKPFVEGLLRLAIVVAKLGRATSNTAASFQLWAVRMTQLLALASAFSPVLQNVLQVMAQIEKASDPSGVAKNLNEHQKFWDGIVADLERTLKEAQATPGKLSTPTATGAGGDPLNLGLARPLKEKLGFGVDEILAVKDSLAQLQKALAAVNSAKSAIPVEAYEAALKAIRAEALKLYELGAAPKWFDGLQVALAQLEKSGAFVDLNKQVRDLVAQQGALQALLVSGKIDGVQYALAVKMISDQYAELAKKAQEAGAQLKFLSDVQPPESPLNDIGVPLDIAKIPGQMAPDPTGLDAVGNQIRQTVPLLQQLRNEYETIAEAARAAGVSFEEMAGKTIFAEAGYQALIGTAEILGAGLAKVAITGRGSAKEMRKALGDMLASLGIEQSVRALVAFAQGVAASTPWGFALLGPPAPYFAAAKFHTVAAAAAIAGSRLLGGGGSGGGAAKGGGAAAGGGEQAVNYAGAARTSNVTGTTPVVAGQAQRVVNYYYDVKALDARSVRDLLLDPQNRRTIREANDLEVGRR